MDRMVPVERTYRECGRCLTYSRDQSCFRVFKRGVSSRVLSYEVGLGGGKWEDEGEVEALRA